MRRSTTVVICSLLMLTLAIPTMAQEEPQPREGWAFRVGPWYPTSRDVRRRTDDLWVYLGVEKDFPGLGTISFDYSEGSGTDSVKQYVLFANSRQKYTPKLDLIGGLGIIYSRVRIGGVSETRTRFGGTIGVAWTLQPKAEIQLRYQAGGFKEVNGFALTFNLRF